MSNLCGFSSVFIARSLWEGPSAAPYCELLLSPKIWSWRLLPRALGKQDALHAACLSPQLSCTIWHFHSMTSILINQLLIKPSVQSKNQTWEINSFHPSKSVPVRKNKVIRFRLQFTPCLGVYLLKPRSLLDPWLKPFSSRCYHMMPKGKLPRLTPIWHQVAVRQDLACGANSVFFDSVIRLSYMPKCGPSS